LEEKWRSEGARQKEKTLYRKKGGAVFFTRQSDFFEWGGAGAVERTRAGAGFKTLGTGDCNN